MSELARTDEIRTALTALVAHGGDVAATAKMLTEEGHKVTVTELRRWRDEQYTELYADIERRHAHAVEAEMVQMLRQRAHEAAHLEEELLRKARNVNDTRDISTVLRAVADVKSKSIDGLMKLTGRATEGTPGMNLEEMISSMAAKGYLKVQVDIEAQNDEGR